MSPEPSPDRFAGRSVIVTGAGSGIGQACAVRMAQAGASVAVLDASASAAASTKKQIHDTGGKAIDLAADVTDEEAVSDALQRASGEIGPPAILVNAAGIIIRKTLLDSSIEEWRRVLDVNLTGYAVLLKQVIPMMSQAGGGSIVQVASIAGHVGYGFSSYTAAKGGVLALTRQLAAELAQHRIRINSVSPGVVQTGLNTDTLSNEAIREATIGNTPSGRLGEPDDIAQAVLFLADSTADFVTGTDLVVDGGMISTIHWGNAGQALHSFHSSE